MDQFEHNGVAMAYESRGSGPAMLFVHNGGTSSTIWRHQLAELSSSYRTVAVDLPGFGSSPRPDSGIDLPGQVEQLEALIDHLELAPLLLVGNCMGSNIAAGIAESRPDDIVGLVLVNPLTEATFTAGRIGLLHTMARRLPGPARSMRRLARRFVPPRLVASVTLRFQLGRKGTALGLHRDSALIAGYRRADQLPALVDVLDDMGSYGVLDLGRRDDGPPLCTVWGAQNRVLSPRAGRALNGRLEPERAELLDRCGHLPMLEDPGAVTAIIEGFAKAHRPAAVASGPAR